MPIMATSFIQMAYSLTDMAWVGRIGSEAVAAVGAVGILTWLSGSIALLNKVGGRGKCGAVNRCTVARRCTPVFVAQHHDRTHYLDLLGRIALSAGSPAHWCVRAQSVHHSAMPLRTCALSLPACLSYFCRLPLQAFTTQPDEAKYLSTSVGRACCSTSCSIPCLSSALGLGTNGAAYATWISQAIVFSIFVYQLRCRDALLGRFPFFTRLRRKYTLRILKLGLPVAGTQQLVCAG